MLWTKFLASSTRKVGGGGEGTKRGEMKCKSSVTFRFS